mmetsp:Transcript_380/g.506  ORF Transcript_380/g.506 Transcript_380/m.506 type:complete len:175 (+) Transcript_380:121-645(+)
MDQNEEALCGQVEDARVTRQGRYSAWLKKAKSENARCKLIQSHNTRYFTIDFDSQIIFYSHSTSQKKVSQPIPFRDILGAERLPLPTKYRKSKTAMIFGFFLAAASSACFAFAAASSSCFFLVAASSSSCCFLLAASSSCGIAAGCSCSVGAGVSASFGRGFVASFSSSEAAAV